MTFKKIVSAAIALCITAILGIALCGCEDLGEYDDTQEYYNSFGDIILIDETSREGYSVADYFYNKESREDFLEGDDGAYKGVEHSDYVYVAIPFRSDIEMDTFALYIHSREDVAVYINVFVIDEVKIPSDWKKLSDNEVNSAGTGNEVNPAGTGEATDGESGDDTQQQNKVYDDPDPETRIGEITVFLKKENWDSFALDRFDVNGASQNSIEIKNGQCILLQIRNNSGVRIFDKEKQCYVDPQTGLELQKAEVTMTNLLIRALDIKNGNEA